MSKSTIFGFENFIEPQMITINQQVENYIVDETYKASVGINVLIDKEKLEKWLRFCAQLERIDETDLIDMATKKRFEQLKTEQNKVAVEKLEELLDWVDAHKQPIGYALRCEINSKIQELKGIKYQ